MFSGNGIYAKHPLALFGYIGPKFDVGILQYVVILVQCNISLFSTKTADPGFSTDICGINITTTVGMQNNQQNSFKVSITSIE